MRLGEFGFISNVRLKATCQRHSHPDALRRSDNLSSLARVVCIQQVSTRSCWNQHPLWLTGSSLSTTSLPNQTITSPIRCCSYKSTTVHHHGLHWSSTPFRDIYKAFQQHILAPTLTSWRILESILCNREAFNLVLTPNRTSWRRNMHHPSRFKERVARIESVQIPAQFVLRHLWLGQTRE